jgi:hypothetical protein
MCEQDNIMNYKRLYDLTEKISEGNTPYLAHLTLPQTLTIIPKLIAMVPLLTPHTYKCSCCGMEVELICPKTKPTKTLNLELEKVGIDSGFLQQIRNLKSCLFPTIAFKDFDDNEQWTFFTYNVLDTIVGTEHEPHKNITMCRICMKKQIIDEIESLPLEGTLSHSSTLMRRHLRDYRTLEILNSCSYNTYAYNHMVGSIGGLD